MVQAENPLRLTGAVDEEEAALACPAILIVYNGLHGPLRVPVCEEPLCLWLGESVLDDVIGVHGSDVYRPNL